MKAIIYLFLLSLFISCTDSSKNSKSTLEEANFINIDSACVYIYDGLLGQPIVTVKKKLDSTIVTSKKLSDLQLKELVLLINGQVKPKPDSVCSMAAPCYEPHHGVVFYKNGTPKYWNSICFSCNGLEANFAIKTCPAQLIGYFTDLHLKIGNQEYRPLLFANANEFDIIKKINEDRFGKDYCKKRHGAEI